MNRQGLTRTFIKAASSSASAALINMLTTVLIARWLGDSVYADYVIDLAMISIILIFIDLVPSNYLIFKVQDDPRWINSAATHATASFVLITLTTVSIGKTLDPFKHYSIWIPVYAGLMAIKRFIDIHQQAAGKIAQFLKLEAYIAGLRLALFLICAKFEIDPNLTVWMSLALATATVQLAWLYSQPEARQTLWHCLDKQPIRELLKEKSNYPPYYAGITLKRLRDNLMALIAERYFLHKDELASFLLAYRGLTFAQSQIRIIEGMLNHRATLKAASNLSTKKKLFIAGTAQLVALTASALILLLSDANHTNHLTTFALSVIIWPATFSVLKRAQAYASYQANAVNYSLLSYITSLTIICAALINLDERTDAAFSIALLTAECVGLFVFSKRTDAAIK